MELTIDRKKLYDIFKAKDARFDGRVFVGVTSTGIYCRPVCRANTPKEKNCVYFDSAAAAERAGFRPCLVCRPELAPGTSVTDASSVLAWKAARRIEESCGDSESLAETAGSLGCSDRHLRRVFEAEFHVTPVQYRQTCRLLLAKNLLTDTDLSVLDIAMASGFGSLRRLNDAFVKHYRMPPTTLRRSSRTQKNSAPSQEICLRLGYRPPYSFRKLLDFFAARAIPGMEKADKDTYCRTVRMTGSGGKECRGWIAVSDLPEKHALSLRISESLAPVLPAVSARVKTMFDLYADPQVLSSALAEMNDYREGLWQRDIRLPGCFDGFETALRAVLGQQITVKAATTLAGRIAEVYGMPLETGIDGLTRTFPTPADLLSLEKPIEEALGELGVIAARSRTIRSLAEGVVQKNLKLDPSADPEEQIQKLLAIKGIGSWSAQYIAMRTMAYPDAFPETDYGVKKALEGLSSKEMRTLAETWRPWRSYAVMGLWNSLK